MKGLTGRCDGCKHWEFTDPEDMGVCTHPDGPGEGCGFGLPIQQAVLSAEIKKRHSGRTATSCDTRCVRFESSRVSET